MIPFLLSIGLFCGLFVYFRKQRRPLNELILFALMSLIGIVQLGLLILDKPIRLTALIAGFLNAF